ncbi:hypothetical protein [Hydrogenophaga sp. 5NK40-0174]|uniref:hypothetical protein n=1 Tax=Hydrogenophaga sp. 5NK40-0174 TaxID=3127649 RepID=UPI003103402A
MKRKTALRFAAAALMVAGLVACGGGGEDKTKDLFSLWNRDSDNVPLDLTGGEFSTPLLMYFYTTDGSQCNCNMTFVGEQHEGTFVVNSCRYVPGSGAGDPGCTSFNGTGKYFKNDGQLTIERDGRKATWH